MNAAQCLAIIDRVRALPSWDRGGQQHVRLADLTPLLDELTEAIVAAPDELTGKAAGEALTHAFGQIRKGQLR